MIGRPGRAPGDPTPDPLETALRGALEREAAEGTPSPDGLRRIRETIASNDARRPAWFGARAPRWRPVLVAAAVGAVVGGGIVASPLLRTPDRDAGPAASSPAVTTGPTTAATPPPEASTSPTRPATGTPAPSSSSAGSAPAAAAALPVYVTGRQGDDYQLFREFRRTTAAGPAARVQAAVTAALGQDPQDGDYTRVWSSGSAARTGVTDTVITIELNQAAVDTDLDRGPASVPGMLALQQLVWTATAAAATEPSRSEPAVRITVPSGADELFGVDLGGTLRRGTGDDDPRAAVWVTSLAEGASVRAGGLTVTGQGVNQFENTLQWQLLRLDDPTAEALAGGALGLGSEADGSGQPPDAGRRGFWRLDLDLDAPGRYLLRVSEDNPKDDTVSPQQDTKSLTVRS